MRGRATARGTSGLFVAVDELVRLVSASRGLVLFIDDLHAADDASLAMLHYIARPGQSLAPDCVGPLLARAWMPQA